MQNLSQEIWLVETQGHIYEAGLEELKQWISEGAVLPSDKVKRGNLRWLLIEKVPELHECFLAMQARENEEIRADEAPEEDEVWEIKGERLCYLHTIVKAEYACSICKKLYCKICPESYGGTVKLCPLCGSLCSSADAPAEVQKSIGAVNKPYYKRQENEARSKSLKRFGAGGGLPKPLARLIENIKILLSKFNSLFISPRLRERR